MKEEKVLSDNIRVEIETGHGKLVMIGPPRAMVPVLGGLRLGAPGENGQAPLRAVKRGSLRAMLGYLMENKGRVAYPVLRGYIQTSGWSQRSSYGVISQGVGEGYIRRTGNDIVLTRKGIRRANDSRIVAFGERKTKS